MTQYKRTPLPVLKDSFGRASVDSAYNLCYAEQQRLAAAGVPDDSLEPVRIRVLGWMFHFAPEHSMLTELSRAIISCGADPEQYNALGQFFIDFWIRPFRNYKRRTPFSTGHASRPSLDTVVEQVRSELERHPENHSTAKKNALIRDGFRCVLIGRYDLASYEKNAEVQDIVDRDDIPVISTQCAHIICESTNLDIQESEKKETYAATAWAVLECFGFADKFNELNGKGIHRLQNILTLSSVYHDLFNQLKLWFEPMDPGEDTHKYKVGTSRPVIFRDKEVPKTVEFTNSTPSTESPLPMPSKRYLVLHAACAKVANMSAAAECLDAIDRERETGAVLAHDGSPALFLEECLRGVLVTSEAPRTSIVMCAEA